LYRQLNDMQPIHGTRVCSELYGCVVQNARNVP